jgi:hypothetical protein
MPWCDNHNRSEADCLRARIAELEAKLSAAEKVVEAARGIHAIADSYGLSSHGCVVELRGALSAYDSSRLALGDENKGQVKQVDAIGRVKEFLKLKSGWDSYDGKPISQRCAREAISLIERLGDGWWPVPCPDGSIQIERHDDGLDIEISISVYTDAPKEEKL